MAITQQLGELVWKITGDDTDVKKKIKGTEDKAKGFGSKVNKALGAISFIAVAAGVTKISKELIKAASDAEEVNNKFAVTFKGLEAESEGIAESLALNYGLARKESKELLSGTADLLQGFGITKDESLALSANVQALAVDLASFTNLEGGAARASEALTKGLLGEREQLKALGIAITETELKRFAEDQGKVFSELTKSEKAVLTYQLAVKQSQNAIGDFERSSQSFANQQKITTARISDLKVALGEQLLPAATESAKSLNEFLGNARNIEIIVKSVSAILSVLKVSLLQITVPFKVLGVIGKAAFTLIEVGIEAVRKKIQPLLDGVNKVTGAIGNFASKVKGVFTKNIEAVAGKLDEVTGSGGAASKAIAILKDGFSDIAKDALGDVNQALTDIGSIFVDDTKKGKALGKVTTKAAEDTKSAWERASIAVTKFFNENKKAIESTLEVVGVLNSSLSSVSDLIDINTEERINAIDKQLTAALESAGVQEETEQERIQRELDAAILAGDTALQKEKENELERLKITEEFEKKKAEAEYKGALAKWKSDVLQQGVSLALAITEALPNIPLAIATGAAGAIQTAAVIAGKPNRPSFDRGTMRVERDTVADVHKDEIILPPALSQQARDEGLTIAPTEKSGIGNAVFNFFGAGKEKLYSVMFDDMENGVLNVPDVAFVKV
jgi:hypothetical protein